MNATRSLLSLVACSNLLLIAGCIGEDDTSSNLDEPAEHTLGGGTSGNGHVPSDLAAAAWDLPILTLQPLPQMSPAWVTDEAHRKTLVEVVRCALPHGASIQVGANTYDGEFGVAAGWQTAPATETDTRWVSACVGALLNAFGTHVPVRLRGQGIRDWHPLPNPSSSLYTVDEISLFGQVFISNPAMPPRIFACAEKRLLDACGGGSSDYLNQRICGQTGNPCNVVVVGACEDVCSGDLYERTCVPWPGGPVFHEVIEVSLLPTSARFMYPPAEGGYGCDFEVASDPRCADGTVEDIFVDQSYQPIAVGCAGSRTSSDRASLCGPGLVPCDERFAEARTSTWPPAFDYWAYDGAKITAPWTPDSYGNTPGGTTAGTACCAP